LIISSSNFSAVQQKSIKYALDEEITTIETSSVNHPLHAIIETTMGDFEVELYYEWAPHTVSHFLYRAWLNNFYNGLVFHRVVDDYLIYGGMFYPDGTAKHNPGGTVDLEIHPNARHVDGAIAMYHQGDPNSAETMFYICDGAQHQLDDVNAVFGKVTDDTMHVVRNIASVPVTQKHGKSYWPVEDVIIEGITIVEEEPEMDIIIKGGLGGFNVLSRYKGTDKPSGEIFVEIRVGDLSYEHIAHIESRNPGEDEWVKEKAARDKFMFGLGKIDLTIWVDYHWNGFSKKLYQGKGFLIGPLVLISPIEISS